MHRGLQFGMRGNPASSRRHGSRQSVGSFPNESCTDKASLASVEPPPVQNHPSTAVDSMLNVAPFRPAASEQSDDLPGFPAPAPCGPSITALTPSSCELKQNEVRSDAGFEPLLDASEAARLLRIHPKTIQRLARLGYVPAFRVGKFWRYRASDLEKWLRSGSHSNGQLADRVDFTKENSQ